MSLKPEFSFVLCTWKLNSQLEGKVQLPTIETIIKS